MSTETIRPGKLDDMVGQETTIARLRIAMAGARVRESKPPHVLLSGPAGTGKTTMANIVGAELGAPVVVTSGPALKRAGDLAGILCQGAADDNPLTVIFIDEIHRLPISVEETLYEALEDGTLSVMAGSGPEAKSLTIKLPPFIVVGATTRQGGVSKPLRDRFGLSLSMESYSVDQLATIVSRHWVRNGMEPTIEAAQCVAERSKGVPRIALHLAERVLDVASIKEEPVSYLLALASLEAFGVGEFGLDEIDWKILTALTTKFRGRPVGLDALSQLLDVDASTIQNEHEPNLVREGLIIRTPSGRAATAQAFEMMKRRAA